MEPVLPSSMVSMLLSGSVCIASALQSGSGILRQIIGRRLVVLIGVAQQQNILIMMKLEKETAAVSVCNLCPYLGPRLFQSNNAIHTHGLEFLTRIRSSNLESALCLRMGCLHSASFLAETCSLVIACLHVFHISKPYTRPPPSYSRYQSRQESV